MTTAKSDIKRGVSLYSFQQEYYLGQMTLEQCIAKCAELGANGIEIVSEMMLPGFPKYGPEVYSQWHGMMERYGTTPTCHDMFYDSKRFKGQLMSDDEAVESLSIDLRHAKKLGCFCIRVLVLTPIAVMERCIPLAEVLGVKMLLEIHSPWHLDHEFIQKHFEMYKRSGSKFVGFMPDMGIFVKSFPRVITDRYLRDGATPHLVERILAGSDNHDDLSALPGEIESRGGTAKDIALARMAGHYVYSNPRRMLDFMPWIGHIHGKFYDMTAECIEPSIPYEDVLPVLAEGGYQGYISAEYEGQRHIQDVFEVDSVGQVERFQIMLSKLIAQVQ
jgi:sugar phosphate isomerase/epimerase